MDYSTVKYAEATTFRDRAMPKLLEAEAENCRIISLAIRLAETDMSGHFPPPRLWTVESDRGVALVAVQKTDGLMEVSRGPSEAVDALVEALVADGGAPAIVCAEPTIAEIVTRYARRAPVIPKLHRRFKGHVLSEVIPPRHAGGICRRCENSDRQTLCEFIDAYMKSIGEPAYADTGAIADGLIDAKRMFVWCDPYPVAMAAWAGPTPSGVRINFVYTQLHSRNRGYASNLVAALSQRLLDEGRRSCFLFTDRKNAEAVRVYQRIGYQSVSDGEHWVFEPFVNSPDEK